MHEALNVTDFAPFTKDGKYIIMGVMKYFVDHGGNLDIEDGDGKSVKRMIRTVLPVIPELGIYLGEDMDGSENNAAGSSEKKKKKIGRNDPCSCGSKKKFKVCCGKA